MQRIWTGLGVGVVAAALLGAGLFVGGKAGLIGGSDRDSGAALEFQLAPETGAPLGLEAPGDLPAYAPLPQGAFVVTSERGAKAGAGVLEFSAPADQAQVLDFYRQAAKRHGMTIQESEEGDRRVVAGKANSSSLQVEVSEAPGGTSFVRMTFG